MDTGRLITRRTVMSATCVATVAAMMSPAPTAEAKADLARPRVMWQQCVERALQCFPTGGGYHTGRNIPGIGNFTDSTQFDSFNCSLTFLNRLAGNRILGKLVFIFRAIDCGIEG